MPSPNYDIFFSGEMIEGYDPETVRKNIERLLKVDSERLGRLFAGKLVKIKGGVDQETAIRYRTTFREAGALIEIRPAEDKKSAPAPTPVQESKENPEEEAMTLLPPKTGSLIDCAREVEPAEIADISSITLSPPGSTIDETEPPPPLIVNTDELSLAPDNEQLDTE